MLTLAPTLPSPQQAESVLGFIERVTLPWILVFVLLALLVAVIWYFSSRLLPELHQIVVALNNFTNSNARLTEEVHTGKTPPVGVPALSPAILQFIQLVSQLQTSANDPQKVLSLTQQLQAMAATLLPVMPGPPKGGVP